MKLSILTPCHDGMYHTNYDDLVAASYKLGFTRFKSETDSDIHRHRSKMISQWLFDDRFKDDWGVLWIDADIGGPPGAIERMASLPTDIHIASGC
jgi:hypothetical protein